MLNTIYFYYLLAGAKNSLRHAFAPPSRSLVLVLPFCTSRSSRWLACWGRKHWGKSASSGYVSMSLVLRSLFDVQGPPRYYALDHKQGEYCRSCSLRISVWKCLVPTNHLGIRVNWWTMLESKQPRSHLLLLGLLQVECLHEWWLFVLACCAQYRLRLLSYLSLAAS